MSVWCPDSPPTSPLSALAYTCYFNHICNAVKAPVCSGQHVPQDSPRIFSVCPGHGQAHEKSLLDSLSAPCGQLRLT